MNDGRLTVLSVLQALHLFNPVQLCPSVLSSSSTFNLVERVSFASIVDSVFFSALLLGARTVLWLESFVSNGRLLRFRISIC